MKEAPLFSVLLHCYYGIDDVIDTIKPINAFYNYHLYINTVVNLLESKKIFKGNLKDVCSSHVVHRRSTNVGKDIGGKLVLLDTYLRLNFKTKYLVFIHDKKSPHLANGKNWFSNLVRIVDPSLLGTILDIFDKDSRVGIIASKGSVMQDNLTPGNNVSNNQKLLSELQEKYKIFPKDYSYVAGTMFWVRSQLLTNFFLRYNPLEIRASLEYGNVLDNEVGTFTHSWERLLSWIVTSQGYSIKEI